MKNYMQIVETLVSIFTVDKGVLKILLMRKKSDPYKGYWILPGEIVTDKETLEENALRAVDEKVGIPDALMEQCYTYSDIKRCLDGRIIATSFISLIDPKTIELKREVRDMFETEWFRVDELPKVGYDHETIIQDAIEYLKKKIVNSNVLKRLFPSDFTLPEIQKVYEQILGKALDRRNFRKKFINLGLIEETGDKFGTTGRPAKLYRFKDEIQERNLF